MKLVTLRSKIKQNQTQTNSFKTKTIQTHSWLRRARVIARKPAVIVFAVGCFAASTVVAAAATGPNALAGLWGIAADSANSESGISNQQDSGSQHTPGSEEAAGNTEPSEQTEPASTNESAKTGNGESSHSSSISIESSTTTTVNGQTSTSAPEVYINGQQVEIPKSGRINENYRDDSNRTRIRARINSENTSINISTKSSVETEDD